MLKGIQKIKGLGVFANYAPPAGTAEFGVKNLIYGWNYSGKTTLSRLFGLLDAKKPNPELPTCAFSIDTNQGVVTEAMRVLRRQFGRASHGQHQGPLLKGPREPQAGGSSPGTGPIIGKTFEITAMHRNGQEFPVELSVSALRIKDQWHALGVIRDISERKRTEEQIRHLAYYDFLTDLPNRRLFIDCLSHGLIQVKRNRRPLAVLYLDLDRFKGINDTLGHDVGDGLLIAVASRLRDCVRSSDTVCRLGGDEFAIVLVEIAQPRDAAVVAEKILERLQETIHVGDHQLKISTSIGIAIYPVDDTDNAQALIKKADIALYEAKGAGRNRYAFATEAGAG